MTINSRMIKLILGRTDLTYIQIQDGKRVQVVPDYDALPYCQRNQFAAFVTSHQTLVVWEDNPRRLIERSQCVQDALIKTIGGDRFAQITDRSMEKDGGAGAASLDVAMTGLEDAKELTRPVMVHQACYTSVAILMLTAAIGSGWRQVAIQQVQDPDWLRLLFLIALPSQACLALVCCFRPRMISFICTYRG
jgi:hypothetical protein